MTPLMKNITWFVQVALLAAILLGLGMGIFIWRYGSVKPATAVTTGRPLLLSPEEVDLGVVNPGSTLPFEVILRNETAETVSVIGVDDCCFCKLMDAPITIPGYERR